MNYSSSLMDPVCSQIDSVHRQLCGCSAHLTVMGDNYAFSFQNWFELSHCLRVPVVCGVVLIFFIFLVNALNCWPSSWTGQPFSSSPAKSRDWLMVSLDAQKVEHPDTEVSQCFSEKVRVLFSSFSPQIFSLTLYNTYCRWI